MHVAKFSLYIDQQLLITLPLTNTNNLYNVYLFSTRDVFTYKQLINNILITT